MERPHQVVKYNMDVIPDRFSLQGIDMGDRVLFENTSERGLV
jgi:hypothetical protein